MDVGNSNHFYHTKFPVLATAIVETMEENIKDRAEWSLLDSRTPQAQNFERIRSRSNTMIAMVRILKGGLRKTELEAIHNEDRALLLLGLATTEHMGEKVKNRILPKMIDIMDNFLGNKVFQDEPPNNPVDTLLNGGESHFRAEFAVNWILFHDLKKFQIIRLQDGYLLGTFRTKAFNALLHDSEFAKELKAPLILLGLKRFRQIPCLQRQCKDVVRIIASMVLRDLRIQLVERIHDLIPKENRIC